MDFETFWDLFHPDASFLNRHDACKQEWDKCPQDKRAAILTWLRQHGAYKGRNPYFFIVDFQVQPSEPTDWNGRALEKGVQYITAKYNGRWGLYSKEDVELFGLEVKS